jgi:hypothetical protein
MPHTTALYYPHIDIHNETWVKTALLYWDKLATIVPASSPEYKTAWCKELNREGLLEAIPVGPSDREIEDIMDQMLDLLTSPALPRTLAQSCGTSQEKAEHLARMQSFAYMHPDKLAGELRYYLRELGLSREGYENEYLRVARPFAEYYMSVLATEKARRLGFALTTYDSVFDDISRLHDAGGHLGTVPFGYYDRFDYRHEVRRHRRERPEAARLLAEGVIAHVVFESLQIHPTTSLSDVLRFRERHADELARFRTAIGSFVKDFQDGMSDAAIYQRALDVYTNELRPQMLELKAKLEQDRLRAFYSAFKSAAFSNATSLALGVALSASTLGPYALAVGAGLSAVLTAIAYRQDREELLRRSPYSYVLAVDKTFGTSLIPGTPGMK